MIKMLGMIPPVSLVTLNSDLTSNRVQWLIISTSIYRAKLLTY
jgi:hypothetical protein